MEEKIKILLDKINMKENSQEFFSDAKLSKIKVTKRLDNKKNVIHLIVYLRKATLSKYATRFIEKQDFNVSPFMVFFAKEDADRVNKFAKENNIKLNVMDTINITIK